MNENGALDIIRSATEEVKEIEAENTRLRERLAQAEGLLKELEWRCVDTFPTGIEYQCPICAGDKFEYLDDRIKTRGSGHSQDCRLAAFLHPEQGKEKPCNN